MTGVTPLGFSLWTEVPTMLERLQAYGVREWRPPSVTNPLLATFWLMAAAFLARYSPKAVARRSCTLGTFWGAVALFPVALNASRNVPALLLVLVPAVGTLVEGWSFVKDRPGRRERPGLNLAVLSTGCVAAIVAVVFAWGASIPKLQWRPLSHAAIAAVEACPESIYNR